MAILWPLIFSTMEVFLYSTQASNFVYGVQTKRRCGYEGAKKVPHQSLCGGFLFDIQVSDMKVNSFPYFFSYTRVCVCVFLDVNFLQFFLKKNPIYHQQKQYVT